MYIPGHEGLVGDEPTDAIARKESEEKLIGLKLFCAYKISHFKEKLMTWRKRKRKVLEFVAC